MYSREYPREQSRGAVKAFEDAYAKEEFLRRSANAGSDSSGCISTAEANAKSIENRTENSDYSYESKDISACSEKDTAKHKGGLADLFKGADSGDLILLLLIVFFLFDSDRENDLIIPVLLAVLLLF